MNCDSVPLIEKAGFFPLFYLREYFFPSGCGGCGAALLSQTDARYGLCGDCRELFAAALDVEKCCAFCGKPLISEKDTCLDCRRNELDGAGINADDGPLLQTRVLFPYMGKFRKILAAYKFGKNLGVGNFFARCLAAALENSGFETTEKTAWVPVPPRPGKIKKQGWDQVEYLAKLLEKENRGRGNRTELSGDSGRSFPVRRCLRRLPSRSQKELNRQDRGGNLKGRILCEKTPPETAVIFDDVITTGATLKACARALLEGGAEKVYGICLFYD